MILKLTKRPIFFVPVIIAIAAVSGYLFFGKNGNETEEITVKRGTITQVVSVTGKTKPAESVDLGFEKGGKIARASVKVGDHATAGQTLVTLESGDLSADLNEAEANLDAEKAKLEELEKGTRPEEIRIQEVKVANAEVALDDAKKNLADKLQDAYTKSDDAVRIKTDQLFSSPRSSNPQFVFTLSDPELELSLERERLALETVFNAWSVSLGKLAASSNLAEYIGEAEGNLSRVKLFLEKAALAANSLQAGASLSQTTIDGYKSDISTARTNANTAIANLSSAAEKTRTAESNLILAENELALKRAGSTPEQISIQEAKVKQAEAKVAASRAEIAKTVITSPIAGTVTKQDAKQGEIVAANINLVSVISESLLEIESNVPEVDIGAVAAGNLVSITLDALAGQIFGGKVAYIEPAETIVDGVVNFKITVAFDRPDPRFKSGLTSNLEIETLKKSDVLVLPQFAIIEKDQGTFVKIMEGGEAKEKPVKIGIRGKDGNIEIVSGLNEGDKVMNIGFKTNGK